MPANLNAHQPMPERISNVDIWLLVLDDMQERNAVGHERYGGPLTPHDGRDSLVDFYQELLDAVVYARKLIWERDHPL